MINAFATSINLTGFGAFVGITVVFLILATLVFIILSPGILVAALGKRKLKKLQDQADFTVIANYEAPKGLSPAEVGLVYDMQCGKKEVLATLLSLVARQVITLDTHCHATIIDRDAYETLADFEKIAIKLHSPSEALQPSGPETVSTLQSNVAEPLMNYTQIQTTAEFISAVQSALRSKSYPMKGYTVTFLVRMLFLALLLSLWPLLLTSASGTYNGRVYSAWSGTAFGTSLGIYAFMTLFFTPIYLLLSYVIIKLYTRIAGRGWLQTKALRGLWVEIEGYKVFLKQVDFADKRVTVPDAVWAQAMPYALAMNIKVDWQRVLTP